MANQPSNINPQTSDESLARAYAETFGTPAGRIVWADLQRRFAVNPFDAANPHVTSYRCGALAVVETILEQITRAAQPAAPRQEQAL